MADAVNLELPLLLRKVEERRVAVQAVARPDHGHEAAAAEHLLDLLTAAGVANNTRVHISGHSYTYHVDDQEHNADPDARRGAAQLLRGRHSLTEPGMTDAMADAFHADLAQIAGKFCTKAAREYLSDTKPAKVEKHHGALLGEAAEAGVLADEAASKVSNWAQAQASLLAPVRTASTVVFRQAQQLVPASRWVVPGALGALAIGGGASGADTLALALVALPIAAVTSITAWRKNREQTKLFRARLDPTKRADAIRELGELAQAPAASTPLPTPSHPSVRGAPGTATSHGAIGIS